MGDSHRGPCRHAFPNPKTKGDSYDPTQRLARVLRVRRSHRRTFKGPGVPYARWGYGKSGDSWPCHVSRMGSTPTGYPHDDGDRDTGNAKSVSRTSPGQSDRYGEFYRCAAKFYGSLTRN